MDVELLENYLAIEILRSDDELWIKFGIM